VDDLEVGVERTQRCEWLARLGDYEIADVAELAGVAHIPELLVIEGPTVGMVMLRVTEGARGELFNFGEVLVTECRVQIDRHEGWAMVMGSRPTAARLVASIDAAIEAGCAPASEVDALIGRLILAQDAALEAERETLAATRVRFETQ
jgi:alpha-D-ribose 1-methylphosphonate 5-triphosphate synthase subunit PhnG